MNSLFYTLIRLIKRHSFRRLFHTYYPIMFQTAYSILGSEALANAALYKTFSTIIPLLDFIPKRNPIKIKGFLLLVVKYTALSMQPEPSGYFKKEAACSMSLTSSSSSLTIPILSELEPVSLDLLSLVYLYHLALEDAARILNLLPQTAETMLQTALHSCEAYLSKQS
ncbi:MAG: hypothetical protein HFI40_10820 [Lachnospiraceae bacterium]|jgi:DNA-directed RNA polymerase specialized sigma24 family protein|nr:hypothetical protein [Lachnospiraceae bacterium]